MNHRKMKLPRQRRMWARSERGVEKCAANESCAVCAVRKTCACIRSDSFPAGPLFAGPLLYPRGGEPTMETAAEPRKEVFVC